MTAGRWLTLTLPPTARPSYQKRQQPPTATRAMGGARGNAMPWWAWLLLIWVPVSVAGVLVAGAVMRERNRRG